MYTVDEIREKQKIATAAKLDGAGKLYDIERVKTVCNGIGAAWMWETIRMLVSRANPSLVVAADIHDLDYDDGGDENDREAADNRFLENGLKMANFRYHWFDVRRYFVRNQARKFYRLLRTFGRSAFNYKSEVG